MSLLRWARTVFEVCACLRLGAYLNKYSIYVTNEMVSYKVSQVIHSQLVTVFPFIIVRFDHFPVFIPNHISQMLLLKLFIILVVSFLPHMPFGIWYD